MSSDIPIRKQFRNVVFTINNYDDSVEQNLKNLAGIVYLVYGKEVGESGTKHLQGYMEFKSPKALSTLKKKLPTAHFEERRGTAKQASEYCKKGTQSHEEWVSMNTSGPTYGNGADVYEFGEINQQGARTDLQPVFEAIDSGMDLATIAMTFPHVWIRHYRGFQDYFNRRQAHRVRCPIVFWLYGEPGSGKTSNPCARWRGDYFIKNPNNIWFDGYHQQKCIIFDDFDHGEKVGFRNLLRIMDAFEYMVEVKGGSMCINSPYIVFTSDRHPRELFQDPYKWQQVERRIFRIIEVDCGRPFVWPSLRDEEAYLKKRESQAPVVRFAEPSDGVCDDPPKQPEGLQSFPQLPRIESPINSTVESVRNPSRCKPLLIDYESEEEVHVPKKRKMNKNMFLDLECEASDASDDECIEDDSDMSDFIVNE